jgi:hypothetical protein
MAHETHEHDRQEPGAHAEHSHGTAVDDAHAEHIADGHEHHDHAGHDHTGHDHAGHDHTGHGHSMVDGSWRGAAQATLHCLTGCAIGEVLGMVIGTSVGLHNAGTVVLSIVLAFVFGYALTMRGVLRAGVAFRQAFAVALAADTVSIAVMELVDNAFVVAVPGALDAGLSDVLFWASLLASLAVASVVTVPVNRAMIARGRGHAVVHHQHHH